MYIHVGVGGSVRYLRRRIFRLLRVKYADKNLAQLKEHSTLLSVFRNCGRKSGI
jgi:hypothetical protein